MTQVVVVTVPPRGRSKGDDGCFACCGCIIFLSVVPVVLSLIVASLTALTP